MLTLDGRMIKQCSPSVQARNDTFRVQKIDRSYWVRPSRYSSVSHIIVDQLVKGPLSFARVVPEVDPIAMALRKE